MSLESAAMIACLMPNSFVPFQAQGKHRVIITFVPEHLHYLDVGTGAAPHLD
jgi:hypothetical protein